MDKISKALRKFSVFECKQVKIILEKIYSKKPENLDLKKLKGRDDVFRARKGNIRIIYRIKDKNIFVLSIERRSDKTYNF